MAITSDTLRGHTDTIILRFLCQGDSYGYQINKNIQKLTNNTYELKEATLYTAFRRLEDAGWIISYWGDENTGARRRYYAITDFGRSAYKANLEEWEISKQMIEKLIMEEKGNE